MTTALGKFYGGAGPENVGRLIAEKPIYLEAVSLGSVFMGAVTYIGNAPNFMVRSIAEDAGVKMPDFFSYVLKYSIPVLMPVFCVAYLSLLHGTIKKASPRSIELSANEKSVRISNALSFLGANLAAPVYESLSGFRIFLIRSQPSIRACLFSGFASGASPARMKP